MADEFVDFLRTLEQRGVVIKQARRGGHLKAHLPNGGMVAMSLTPRNKHRAIQYVRRDFRRAGMEV